MSESLSCWIVTDGKAGTENQCLGLAEALNLSPTVKRVTTRFPWTHLPAHLWPIPLWAQSPERDQLKAPWPDLLIASGRPSAAPAAAIRKKSKGKTRVIFVQGPRLSPSRFDVVVSPFHDQLSGNNILTTHGALHKVTKTKCDQAIKSLKPRISHLKPPYVAVLIGGPNKYYQLDDKVMNSIGQQLAALSKKHNVSLLITGSRRTKDSAYTVLHECLKNTPHMLWDWSGENPYLGFLGIADHILLTQDSVSMASEAASTGKPVYIIPLPGKSDKFQRFHKHFQELGYTRPFQGNLENWTYPPLDEPKKIAEKIRKILNI
ncbi:MAG: hypothetical protein HOI80_01100 [Alphaproteobacteria bacterium]|jgi:uncharacterized protein|nr:hypothetical protein [Alphaproteobacteria bacterium]MBT5390413.1 hypothetical protein [Alphaproteobacteria bacterium]MBT5540739.1 hypothetical protein [Alphaproteobacteria bacterium]MBT5654083.1 hypothetical protein [Alphaproteobacteria bacterium]